MGESFECLATDEPHIDIADKGMANETDVR